MRLKNGMMKYILEVTAEFTESDATAVGAVLIKHLTSLHLAIVKTLRSNFITYVEGGQANANILSATEDINSAGDPNTRTAAKNIMAKKGTTSNAYAPTGQYDVSIPGPRSVDSKDAFNKNLQWEHILHNCVTLVPGAEGQPYNPPTPDHCIAIAGTVTWNGTTTVACSDTSKLYKGCKIRKHNALGDAGNKYDPWFIVTAITANTSVTIINREQRTIPTGSGGDLLLQGSGIVIGHLGDGLMAMINDNWIQADPTSYYGENAWIWPGIRLWNKGQAHVPAGQNATQVAASRLASWDQTVTLSGAESAKLGGHLGLNIGKDDPESVTAEKVWGYEMVSLMYTTAFSEDDYPIACLQPDDEVADIAWPVVPVSVPSTNQYGQLVELTCQDTAQFRRMPWEEDNYFVINWGFSPLLTTGPVDMVRLDKEPNNWFQIVSIDDVNKKITILVKPGCTTPTQGSAADTSSFAHQGRQHSLMPHAKHVHYAINDYCNEGWGMSVGDLLIALDRAVTDGCHCLHFYGGYWGLVKDLYGDVQPQRRRNMVIKALDKMRSDGIVLFANFPPGCFIDASDANKWAPGPNDIWPPVHEAVIICNGVGPRDYDCESSELSSYVPDPDKAVQSRIHNLCRPQFCPANPFGAYWDLMWWGIFPDGGAWWGSLTNVALAVGAFDPRYLDTHVDGSMLIVANMAKMIHPWYAFTDYVANDARFSAALSVDQQSIVTCAPEIGNNVLFGLSVGSPTRMAGIFAIAQEAYIKKNGSAADGPKLIRSVYKTCYKNIGPATDDAFYRQTVTWNGKVVFANSATRTIIPAGNNWDSWVDGFLSDGTVVPGIIPFVPGFTGIYDGEWVHDTAFQFSKPGVTQTMGQGVPNVKALIAEIVG